MSKMLFVLLVVTGLQVVRVASFNLTFRADHVLVTQAAQSVSLTCSADVALAGCQFRWWDGDLYGGPSPVLELSRGSQSRANPAHLDDGLTSYSYSGRGLGAGDCGVSLQVNGFKTWMVACRVRAESGGWKYAQADLYSIADAPLPNNWTTPREVVALPGGEARFMLKAGEPLSWCCFHLPNRTDRLPFTKGAESRRSSGRHLYLGAGLQSGECGLALSDISEEDNGPIRCSIRTYADTDDKADKDDTRYSALIVARPPTTPALSLVYTGNNVRATCEVQGSRPVANISWVLGDAVIHHGVTDDTQATAKDEWMWPWTESSIKQTLTLQLQPQDHGQVLKCVVSHVALSQPLEASRLLPFTADPASNTSCPPLTSQTLQISCFWAGETVNCSQPQKITTEALLDCKPGFVVPNSVGYMKVICGVNGTWNKPVFTCKPDCGRRNTNQGQPLISGGRDVKIGEFPWHVAIYVVMPTFGNMTQWCGGTLIKPDVVLSAAHCFWDSSYERMQDASLYKVAAGKLLRAWDDPDPSVQKRNVSVVVIHELFLGRSTGFGYDIGYLRVDSPFNINLRINLVCLDRHNTLERRQLTEGSVGVVAGWGYTEQGAQSDSLKYVDLPFVPSVTCLASLARELKSLLTSEKICAGYINQSRSVCGGDSGGGLVFPRRDFNKYYLRGIVSIAFKPTGDTSICYSQHYTAFTKFSSFLEWLREKNVV